MAENQKGMLFGTDGIRGKVGSSLLTPHGMYAIGRSLGQVLCDEYAETEEKTVAIARDSRASGLFIQSALIAGLNHWGIRVQVLGVLPTPAVSYFVEDTACIAGIMITASHNPASDNGIKLFAHTGDKLFPRLCNQLIDYLNQDSTEQDHDVPLESTCVDKLARSHYLNKLSTIIQPYQHYFKNKHVVIDAANGAVSTVAEAAFRDLGCCVTMLNHQPNGHDINEQCGTNHPESLQKQVLKDHASFGVAFDGDGDRVLLVDQLGRVLCGDHLLLIHAVIGSLDKVVTTPMANQGLIEALSENGTQCIISPVGDQNVYQKMQSTGASIGAESNGHFIALAHSRSGDGLLAALLTLSLVLKQGKQLDYYHDAFCAHPQQLINIRYNPEHDDQNVSKAIKSMLGRYPHIDATIRASGTEPLLRVNLKARPEHASILNEVVTLITRQYSENCQLH